MLIYYFVNCNYVWVIIMIVEEGSAFLGEVSEISFSGMSIPFFNNERYYLLRRILSHSAKSRIRFTERNVSTVHGRMTIHQEATSTSHLWWDLNPWPILYRSIVGVEVLPSVNHTWLFMEWETKLSPENITFHCWRTWSTSPKTILRRFLSKELTPPRQLLMSIIKLNAMEVPNYPF